ncbi:RAD55 family ATPase [Natronoglomus mannanivorans]|uniref:Recombinase RecA n=1 Tax=Natronoglomus mannanivorans TaxID=2979990 RepID=A0AAP2Z512_9EURY|nr:recombinase RecA [Halobacteria archaeon AArc-xg1-1]
MDDADRAGNRPPEGQPGGDVDERRYRRHQRQHQHHHQHQRGRRYQHQHHHQHQQRQHRQHHQQQRQHRQYQRQQRCSHCTYPIADELVQGTDDAPGPFCSEACRDAAAADEIVRDDGYKRFTTGVEPLETLVPRGVPSDAFVLLTGDEGTRRTELTTELVWRALTRGEPAVIVAFTNPPIAVLERFFALDWNPLPYLEMDRLRIVDCFTHRLEDRDAFENTRNDWGRFVGDVAEDAVVAVRDPSDVREVANALDRALDDLEMTETGVVVLDSIDEIDTLVQDRLIHNFVTDVRATVCKARFVPMFASATTSGDRAYPIDDEYVFDGIVDFRLADDVIPETRLTQLGVRKLVGAQFVPQWETYAVSPGRGLFTFDPETESTDVFTRID